MRRNIKRFLYAFLTAVLLIGAAGITFSALEVTDFDEYGAYAGPAQIVFLEETGGETDKSGETLSVNQPMTQRPYIKNIGKKPCYLRIRVQIPEYEGEQLLELGEMSEQGFIVKSFYEQGGSRSPYWERQGEYIYYRNSKTDNRLPVGGKTPEIYSAVRISPDISQDVIQYINAEQTVIFYAQTTQSGDGGEEAVWTEIST